MKFSRANVIKLWIVITGILISLYFLSKSKDVGTAFFLLINGLNAVLIVIALLFKTQITNAFISLEKLYLSIQHNSDQYKIGISYRSERIIGTLLVIIVSTLGLYVMTLASWDKHAYRRLIEEDGIIEYASSFFWGAAAIVLVYCTIKKILPKKYVTFGHSPIYCSLPFLLFVAAKKLAGVNGFLI